MTRKLKLNSKRPKRRAASKRTTSGKKSRQPLGVPPPDVGATACHSPGGKPAETQNPADNAVLTDGTGTVWGAAIHIMDYVTAGADRGQITSNLHISGSTSFLVLWMEKVERKTVVPIPGLPGSGVMMVAGFPDVILSEPLADYIKARILEHLSTTSEMLVVIIPTRMIQKLILDVLSEEEGQQTKQFWDGVLMGCKHLQVSSGMTPTALVAMAEALSQESDRLMSRLKQHQNH